MFDLMGRGVVMEYVKERVKELKVKVNKLKVIYGSYCSKDKLGKGEFNWDVNGGNKYKVGEIYRGERWNWIREEVGNRKINVEEVYVFSGKYGMINWNMEIEYYDVYFGKDKLEDGKKWVSEWCKGMIDKYGAFKLVYWVDGSIYKLSKQYVDVMDVIKKYGCELEIREI